MEERGCCGIPKTPNPPSKSQTRESGICFYPRSFLLIALILLVCGASLGALLGHNYWPAEQPVIFETEATALEVRFSPNGGCTNEILKQLNNAQKKVRVFAYSFTSEPIAQALILLAMGGIDVQVVIDSGSAKRSEADNLASNGVKVYLDNDHAIMHNKVIIIDDDVVVTGSMNYSKSGEEKNAENVIVVRNKRIVQKYIENWEEHKKHSKLKAPW